MAQAEKGYDNILCCLDFSDRSDQAFNTALDLARKNQAALVLLHVVTPHSPLLPGMPRPRNADLSEEGMLDCLEQHLNEHYLNRTEGVKSRAVFRKGLPSVEILNYINEDGVDLVVLGSAGLQGMGLFLLGSVAERVSRRAPCSCLVVR